MSIKDSRLQGIIIAASKQTLKAKFTVLQKVIPYKELINSVATEQAFIPHLNDKTEYLGKIIKPHSSYTVLIGPEGDFTDQEVKIAIQKVLSLHHWVQTGSELKQQELLQDR